jgi:heterodisulfide reductase subunit A
LNKIVKKMTGIIFTKPEDGYSEALDYNELFSYAEGIPGVGSIWYSIDLPIYDKQAMAKLITERQLNRIVIAGDTPGTEKSFVTNAMIIAGNNPEDVVLASFREYGITKNKEIDMAKAILFCSVLGVSFEEAAMPEEANVHPDTLVIGGGIAGIQASLEIANGNQKVYLLERTGTIGGHMAMFDKTFPTLDCAACILTPKMVEVGQHRNIELITYSEVKGVTGEPGNYEVKILQKARRVNLATCIGCGICSGKCPVKVPSEFDSGTTLRKAIYIAFPQAVPNKYLIDADSCTYVQTGKCGVCAKVCPVPGCINLDEKDQEVEIVVGNIIVATGFKPFDAGKIERFGYGKFPQVITSLELERLINAAGPTEGNIHFRSQDKKGNWIFSTENDIPKSFAIIHCVGSRDENFNKYCSRVCCMYSLKLNHLIKEKLPEAEVYEYYIDMRAFGKGYEEFYERINEEDVHIIRGRTAKIQESNKGLLVRSEDILNDQLIEQEVDMVVLAVGLEPKEDAAELAGLLGISISEEGWFNEANYNSKPVNTIVGGITIAGVCQGPKDIPDSVAQGSAAAARVLQSIIKGKIKRSIKDLSLEKIEEKAKQFSNSMEGIS